MVEKVVNDRQSVGIHFLDWNAGKVASGIYLYQLQLADKVPTQKMILIK